MKKIQKKRKDNKIFKKVVLEFLCNGGGWTEIYCETNKKKSS